VSGGRGSVPAEPGQPQAGERQAAPGSGDGLRGSGGGGRVGSVTFHGWPAESLEFYEGLEADNSKTYWTEHKAVYDEHVLAPMTALLDELAGEFGEAKVFRPYRDVRFSADKTPYKTHIGATLSGGGYVQFSAQGLAAGSGYHMMASDQVDRYRKAVADDRTGVQLRGLLDLLEKQGIEIAVSDALKTVPRGYPKDHPRADLLRNKGLIAWLKWPVEAWLETADAKDRVVWFFRAALPLREWLDGNVGATDMPGR
jgi:uncharacterized protein (TIGR02453 family)